MTQERNPAAHRHACVLSNDARARFTVLTPRLFRMEWSPARRFEDRASLAVINRRLPVPPFTVERTAGALRIITDRATLVFRQDGRPFNSDNLRVQFTCRDRPAHWTPGADDAANLRGTTRTLDNIDGPCPVEPGLLSRDGWALIDDSRRPLLDPDARPHHGWTADWPWPAHRPDPEALDWYLLCHGRDYTEALRDFTRIAGRIPLPPRFVFGSWWSRYWAYTDAELRALVQEFRTHDVPVDVLVIDMDWHLDGWTGYTWNPACFPDPEGFLRWARDAGLRVTLNLHPADGVGPHEHAFEAVCRDTGHDPASTTAVPFDCTDRRFINAYFTHLHWPLERQGVDFWWMDWQQGTSTAVPGLDPLFWLNHLHWTDMERRQNPAADPSGARAARRPLIFSRWGGLGNHRYPIGFSGDTYSTWRSLAFQPWFTATAGNVGYAYWSHDIGGHQPGPVEPELYARWVQFGALSPVLRTHTSKNPQGERRIWASPEREFKAMRAAFHLRYRLIPYIYTAARRAFDDALPLCRPLYLHWPDAEESYNRHDQYMLGDDLMAAPVCTPGDPASGCAARTVWLPPGAWTHWYTGQTIEGPCERTLMVPIDQIPLFARAGAVIPCMRPARWSDERPLDPLTLILWPAGSAAAAWKDEAGAGSLYEDDGESAAYARGQCARTRAAFTRAGDTIRLRIDAADGRFDGMTEQRALEIRLPDRWPARAVAIDGTPAPRAEQPPAHDAAEDPDRPVWWYEHDKLAVVVRAPRAPVHRPRTVEITLDDADEAPLRAGIHGRLRELETIGLSLGDHAPPPIASAARGDLRRAIIDRRAQCEEARLLTDDARWELALAVARSGAPDRPRNEAVCRLLALSLSIDAAPDPHRPGAVVTTATLTPLAEGLSAVRADLRISPSRPWTLLSPADAASGPIDAAPLAVAAAWAAEAPPHMTSLRAAAALTRGGDTIRVHAERAILPSINGWWVAGPFPCPFERSMATPFGPEAADPASPDTSAVYDDGAGRPVRWRRAQRPLNPGDDPAAEFVVDLNKALDGPHEFAVAYALCYLHAAHPTEATLALGSDDGVAVWLNGRKVHEHQVQRGYGTRQDAAHLSLREGSNTLLLKITQARAGWFFAAHLLDRDGHPPRGVDIRLTP